MAASTEIIRSYNMLVLTLQTETTAYNERCREIARETFYIMSEVRNHLGTVKLASRH
jgi:secreted trypsin-like serine protease